MPQSGDVLLAGPAGSGAILNRRSNTTVRLIRATEVDTTALANPDTLRFVHLTDGLSHVEGERVSAGGGLQTPAGAVTSFDWATDGAALLFTMPGRRAQVQ